VLCKRGLEGVDVNNCILTLACLVVLCSARPAAIQDPIVPPPIFAALSYEAAVAQTVSGEKILVVKATAEWCLPCKQMDKTTWVDPKVVEWFKANGLAVQFDVDKHKELSARLGIEAMPTMIAYVRGQEFDRIVGFKSPTDLLIWTEGVKSGKRAIELVRTRAASAESGTEEEVDARYDLAKQLVQSGDLDRATEEFFWVWTHSKDTRGYGGVRGSFMASEIAQLVKRHPPARENFVALRDQAGRAIGGEKIDPDVLHDWVILNNIVGEPQATLEWFDRVKDKPEWWPLIRRVESRLDDLLEAEGRWGDLAALYPDPVDELRSKKAMLSSAQSVAERTDGDRAERLSTVHQQMYRRTASKLYAIMLAAERAGDAEAVLAEAIRSDDTAEMRIALVDYALKVDRPEAKHLELVASAERMAASNENLGRLVASTKANLARAVTGARSK
jgi:thioredoxin-like negative regulator of GroEL